MRLVLAPEVRFRAVDEHLTRCGLSLAEVEPQVFPARPEPAAAFWAAEDGEIVAVFGYQVNPDRRTLVLVGDEAEPLASTVSRTLGVLSFEAISEQLETADSESAFIACFLLAATGDPRAFDALARALDERDEHVAVGCIRSMELLGDPRAVPLLREVRRDPERAGEVRLLAGEIADALGGTSHLH